MEVGNDVKVVFRKEVLETIRDYKNLLVIAFVPLIFLPLAVAGTQTMLDRSISHIEKQKFKVAVYGDAKDHYLQNLISATDKDLSFIEPAGGKPDQAVEAGKIDLAIVTPPQLEDNVKEAGAAQTISLVYDARYPNAAFAFARARHALHRLKQELSSKRVQSAKLVLPPEPKIAYINQGKKGVGTSTRNIAALLPYLLLVIVLIVILSPSLDLFTGEKERGTLSLLMVAPVSLRDIVLGKLAVVCLFGQSAVTLGLFSFYVSFRFFAHQGNELISLKGVGPESIILIFVFMAPLVVLLSSMSVMLASKCNTFQQGQGYYLPFMCITMFPAGVLSINDASLSTLIAFVPIGNVCLVMREVLLRNYDWSWLTITFLVSFAYAWLAARQAIRLFDRSEQLERDHAPRYLRWRNGDYRLEAGLMLCASFLLMFYVGQTLQGWNSLWGTAISQLVAVLLPAVVVIKLLRLPLLKTLSIAKPSWKLLLGAVLVSPLAALISIGIAQLQAAVLPVPESFAKAFSEMLLPAGRSLPIAVVVFAVLPALCEELLFRGAFLGLLRKRLSTRTLIILVGIIFGAFHLSTFRFLPTAMLGILLSAIVAISGSIFPAMALHALHNGILIVAQVNHIDHLTKQQVIAVSVISLLGGFLLWNGLKARKISA